MAKKTASTRAKGPAPKSAKTATKGATRVPNGLENPGAGGETHQIATGEIATLTTQQGMPTPRRSRHW